MTQQRIPPAILAAQAAKAHAETPHISRPPASAGERFLQAIAHTFVTEMKRSQHGHRGNKYDPTKIVQRPKAPPGTQYPEFQALYARNVASGKWTS